MQCGLTARTAAEAAGTRAALTSSGVPVKAAKEKTKCKVGNQLYSSFCVDLESDNFRDIFLSPHLKF